MLDKMYQVFMDNQYIAEQAKGRIKYFEYPATADVKRPYIILDEIGPPMPVEYGDNKEIAYEQIVQVDVWTRNRKLTRNLANVIRDTLRNAGITQSAVGPSEYDEGVFRDARRYTYKFDKEDTE